MAQYLKDAGGAKMLVHQNCNYTTFSTDLSTDSFSASF